MIASGDCGGLWDVANGQAALGSTARDGCRYVNPKSVAFFFARGRSKYIHAVLSCEGLEFLTELFCAFYRNNM